MKPKNIMKSIFSMIDKCKGNNYKKSHKSAGNDSHFSKQIFYRINNWELRTFSDFIDKMNKVDIKEKYQTLIKNLDEDSICTVNTIISRILYVNRPQYSFFDIFTDEEKQAIADLKRKFFGNIIRLNDNCWAYNKYFLPINHFEPCVFYDKHSINEVNQKYFEHKDIIDAGGFIGDSAIVLADYTKKFVYSFEPEKNNYENLLKTIELNNKKNIIAINCGLGEKEEILKIDKSNSVSQITTNDSENIECCKVIKLDDYVKEKQLNVGLIKTDLEGYESIFLNGAIDTIRQQRPTLLISIYHNFDDFFNIKKRLEDLNLGYKFKIIKPVDGQILLETLLIAEVEPIVRENK